MELDQAAGDNFVIEANNILVNTGHGGVDNFDDYQTVLAEALSSRRKRKVFRFSQFTEIV